MAPFKPLSLLLCYPQDDLIAALPEIAASLGQSPVCAARVRELLDWLGQGELIDLQQTYVETFDRQPAHALHLFEHIHGEDRARGQALLDLQQEYARRGLAPLAGELPDYVPLFLEFLAQCPPDEAARLLGDAVHVLAHLGNRLRRDGSPYAGVFDALVALSPVVPEPLTVPPVRDMDEMLQTFGPGADGVEPLLRPGAAEPVRFYRSRPN